MVKDFANKRNLKVIGISSRKDDNKWMRCLNRTNAGNFLYLINNADYVFTDSYHGSIFSILYKKRFWTFERFHASDPICQNSRIEQLKRYFRLKNQMRSCDTINEMTIDYSFIYNKLNSLRNKSIDFLNNSLK